MTSPSSDERARFPLPPVAQIEKALPDALHRRLLRWVLGSRGAFEDSLVTGHKRKDAPSVVDPARRVSLVTRGFGDLGPELHAAFSGLLATIASQVGLRPPLPTSIELEIAAHGDGAHFVPHLDIPFGRHRFPLGYSENEDRVLSAVYYFHRQPKAFSGGELRLYAFGAADAERGLEQASWLDFEPDDGRLIAFPSWAVHEVRPVSCPSGRFEDSRFAVNCWYCRAPA